MSEKYLLTEALLDDRKLYGISIVCDGVEMYVYKYISASKHETEKLLARISDEDVAPVHYDDIVRDFIVECAYDKIQANGI